MTVSQNDFVGALLNPNITPPKGLRDPEGRPAGKRFNVYRNTVVCSLIAAMETAFPVVHKLLGDVHFKTVSAAYVRAHPPSSPILMLYGAEFPTFLKTSEHIKTMPFLPEVANLELARRHSYHAADVNSITPEQLAAIPPDDLVNLKFKLAPSMRLILSEHPILSIWNTSMANENLVTEKTSKAILLTRPIFDVNMQNIDQATYIFLSSLTSKTLGDAFDAALEIDATFDLTTAVKLLLDQYIIVEIMA